MVRGVPSIRLPPGREGVTVRLGGCEGVALPGLLVWWSAVLGGRERDGIPFLGSPRITMCGPGECTDDLGSLYGPGAGDLLSGLKKTAGSFMDIIKISLWLVFGF